jgi:Txe/YoeB family toxin of Txe-Axe toxin-antitoxin module
MRSLIFEPDVQEDLFHWAKVDIKILRKIIDLLERYSKPSVYWKG